MVIGFSNESEFFLRELNYYDLTSSSIEFESFILWHHMTPVHKEQRTVSELVNYYNLDSYSYCSFIKQSQFILFGLRIIT